MAIFKPSNLLPNLQEIDLNKGENFSCQINTSGEKIVAYKLQLLSKKGDEVIYSPSTPEILVNSIKNKQTLITNVVNVDTHDEGKILENETDYQWNIRVYSAEPSSEKQPNTFVCDGYLVGSTKYVTWSRIPNPENIEDEEESKKLQEILDQLVYDRYIEFTTNNEDDNIYIGAKDVNELSYPKKYPFIERRKIDWVDKSLGTDEDIVKIETTENFTYNYKNGTPYKIYRCSDKHTVKNVFADPNSEINLSNYIIIYDDYDKAKKAQTDGDDPSTEIDDDYSEDKKPAKCMQKNDGDKIVYKARKITGYSSDTGEIRVNDSFAYAPENGQYYRIFQWYAVSKTYQELDANNLATHIIGGTAIANEYFKVMTNEWTDDKIENENGISYYKRQIFVQPNINIKTDDTNPNEIVFEDGTRIDILKRTRINEITGDLEDITFNKLDNTQWLLENTEQGEVISTPSDVTIDYLQKLLISQRDYEVYTDFIDSSPNCIFYARKTPNIIIYSNRYIDSSDSTPSIIEEDGSTILNYKDAEFIGQLPSDFKPNVKYYQYTLYAGQGKDEDNLVAQSEEIYDNSLIWYYRGLESYANQKQLEYYTISLIIVDKYDAKFEKTLTFGVRYKINTGFIPLSVTLECHEKANQLLATAPLICLTEEYNDELDDNEESISNDDTYIERLINKSEDTENVTTLIAIMDNNEEYKCEYEYEIKFFIKQFAKLIDNKIQEDTALTLIVEPLYNIAKDELLMTDNENNSYKTWIVKLENNLTEEIEDSLYEILEASGASEEVELYVKEKGWFEALDGYYHNYARTYDESKSANDNVNKVLNYTKIESTQDNISIPNSFTFNTQFRLTSNFVSSLMKSEENEEDDIGKTWGKGSEKTIFKIKNDNNTYELKLTSLERYYKIADKIKYDNYPHDTEEKYDDYDTSKWVDNEESFSFKLYKNNEEVNCFSNGSKLWDLEKNTDNLFRVPHYLKYSLQLKEEYRPVINEDGNIEIGTNLLNVVFVNESDFLALSTNDRETLIKTLFDKKLNLGYYPNYTVADKDKIATFGKAPVFGIDIMKLTDDNNNFDISKLYNTQNEIIVKILGYITAECSSEEIINIPEKYIYNNLVIPNDKNFTNIKITTEIKKAIVNNSIKKYTRYIGKENEEGVTIRYSDDGKEIKWIASYEDLYIVIDHLLQLPYEKEATPNPIDLSKDGPKFIIMRTDDNHCKYVLKIEKSSDEDNVFILSPANSPNFGWDEIAENYYVLPNLYQHDYGYVYYSPDEDEEQKLIWIENGETMTGYNLNHNKKEFDKVWFQLYLSDDNNGNITCIIHGREGVAE